MSEMKKKWLSFYSPMLSGMKTPQWSVVQDSNGANV